MRLFAGTPWDRPPRCDRCGQLEAECACPPPPPPRIAPEEQTAKLAIEKRAKGKVATVVRGLPAEGNDLAGLLTQLKNACGAGGTVKDEILEIQGRHLDRVREVLEQIGYRVKG
jgi:translation initiation factor 1